MNKENPSLMKLKNHLETALELLQSDRELTADACREIEEELEAVKALPAKEPAGEEQEMNMSFEELVRDFNTSADDSTIILQEMLRAISAGRVPEDADVKAFDQNIQRLKGQYASIEKCVASQISAEEMPAPGSPVAELVEALKNSKSIQYQKQLDAIRKTLEAFVSVRSLIERYANALRPYQEKAEELLSRIVSQEEAELDALADDMQGPIAFMDALDCEEYDSEENYEKLELVSQFFTNQVQLGLATKKYFLDTDALNAISVDVSPEEVSSEESAVGTTASTGDVTTEPEQTKLPETEELSSKVQESTGDLVGVTSAEETGNTDEATDDVSVEPYVSEFVKKLEVNGGLIRDGESIGLMSKDVSPSEDKKVSSSVFTNEIRKMNVPAAKKILEWVTSSNCVSADLMAGKGVPVDIVDRTLMELQKKGYLRLYTLTPGGSFYCASPRLMKALGYKEASKFVGVRQKSMEDWGETIEDKETSAAARVAFSRVFADAHIGARTNWPGKRFTTSDATFTDAFCFKMFDPDSPDRCVVAVGGFWDSTIECDNEASLIQDFISGCNEAAAIIFAGIDIERAQAIASTFMGVMDYDFSKAKIILFSLSAQSYYYAASHEEMEVTDVFAINETRKSEGETNDEIKGDVVQEDTAETENGSSSDLTRDDETEADSSEIETEPPVTENISVLVKETTETHTSSAAEPDTANKQGVAQGSIAIDEVRNNIYCMLSNSNFYAAAAYAKTCSQTDESRKLYESLAYAVNDPMAHCTYSAENAFQLMSKRSVFDDAMVISSAIRTFFSDQIRYDYQIKAFYDGIKGYSLFGQFPALSNVLYSLMEFKDAHKKGMDAYADYRAKSQAELEKEIAKLRHEANNFYDNFVMSRKKENASQKRFLETKKMLFSVKGDFGFHIKAIVDGDREMLPLTMEFLQKEFLKDDGNISEESINPDKVWDYIVRFWEKAGDNMMYRRHADLMSRLRSNITSTTMNAIQLLVRWCVLVDQASNSAEDEGSLAYKRQRKPLLDDIKKSIDEIETVCGDDIEEDEKAGLRVLIYTLGEIFRCLNASFDENERRYFYAPFLLTDDIMLDEYFIPDLDVHGASLAVLNPANRILAHLKKMESIDRDYGQRLTDILENQEDNYGTAKLLVRYLSDMQPAFNTSEVSSEIGTGINYAKDEAERRKNDFIGELELAQSYGQIDNSEEDKKEKILQIVDAWYEWATYTSNYGFFKKVMQSYLVDISEAAKTREADLLEQLETFRTAQITGLTAEARERRAKRIQEMIRIQNYTVAEVLLARTSNTDDENEDVIDEDFLKEFLDNYDDYYRPVSTHKSSFSSLVSSRTRNKEERGAKRLADNWLPGGSRLGTDRLKNLLNCLGFKVESVKDQSVAGRFEGFIVMTAAATGGQRDNYTHPIAAFGSGASQEGFRVVCINGGYDADGLIDLMKQIGNSKHTLILHDYALTLSERRRLARKAKNALGDKFFGVIDRTVMMFLVRNYDETKINRMLISLIMPFGYYQPYVWESVNVMPPEIFMGRKVELERIKSPTGVNIVYGGRQLGKSALLKKAKEDIDWNENGDRAVYIDIKGLNYEEAANKIGHELYDQYVFTTDIDTTDWGELSRAIRRRLQDQNGKKIPYLLLLLDEADTFIESCELVNYKPMDALKDIQNIGANRFKFVIAGLRNIVRFKREVALGNNSVLTHLESMTVKPFNTAEARELMELPLHYLGLRFPKAKESLITLILANTNYFPGLIQMYCAKLLEAMRNKDYAGYDEVNTPIYDISESHIKKVLADPEFMQQIREKFIITLRLDEDNYYYLIALIMAYLYHQNGYNTGYSAADIHNTGSELDINKISDLDITKLAAFMEELKELNVLRSTDDTHYLFTRFTFFQMMGTSSEVEDKLADYMEA